MIVWEPFSNVLHFLERKFVGRNKLEAHVEELVNLKVGILGRPWFGTLEAHDHKATSKSQEPITLKHNAENFRLQRQRLGFQEKAIACAKQLCV